MSTMVFLPPEMLSDVLTRLPVKSLLRFRSISKPVCSIIDAPDFANLHLNNNANNNNKCLLLCNKNCPLFSVDFPSLERAVEMDHPLKTLNPTTKVLGSCNGLLCLLNSDSEANIVIWNMSTRTHHRLPYLHTVFPNHNPHIDSHQAAYGFGFDSVHCDYKVVRIVRFCNTLDAAEVMVYSLKSNSWKKKACRRFPYKFLHRRCVGMLADGALHWLVNTTGVVAFDLTTAEEFREISPSLECMSGDPYELMWLAFEGRLCVIGNGIAKGAEIWLMKRNDATGESSWTKLLSISDPLLTFPHRIVLVAYLRNGNELLFVQDADKFLSYDLETNKVKNVGVRGAPSSLNAVTYVESLVKPFPMVKATVGKHKSKKSAEKRHKSKTSAAKRNDFLSKGFKLVL